MDLGKLFYLFCVLGGAVTVSLFILLTLIAHEYRRWVSFEQRYVLYRRAQQRIIEKEKERIKALEIKQAQHAEYLRKFTSGEIG